MSNSSQHDRYNASRRSEPSFGPSTRPDNDDTDEFGRHRDRRGQAPPDDRDRDRDRPSYRSRYDQQGARSSGRGGRSSGGRRRIEDWHSGEPERDNARDPLPEQPRPPGGSDDEGPAGAGEAGPAPKMGSYKMRQSLQFQKRTPAFLQRMMQGVGDARPTPTPRRAVAGESELDDDGPTIVWGDEGADANPPQLTESELAKLKILHPGAKLAEELTPAMAPEEPAEPVEPEPPAVDEKSGKLLFRRPARSSDAPSTGSAPAKKSSVQIGKASSAKASSKARPAKGGSGGKPKSGHLLSFDE
ncbi:hypothetical protein AMAG_05548 [Allomyces macrogynus ATCC 38327]|uniref:DUF4604 domain-containing protein n=1 Tax=Allomyces macrogynus (strain ATCC 38327) TaxID=578462 RepID=A0A0L0SCL0_ALLM3|nr:hypothetical protein AMAG_05548 [Allomyces macrogynus ATCC 38327]|eukprot:KNE60125.1 hypothetical protein AMAG_05548 [Allomyces macrogynus ATCC 38327]